MAQALPRYCPRCGAPTQADMQRCPTCGLPVEAMLSRPDNRQLSVDDYSEMPTQEVSAATSWSTGQEDQTASASTSSRSQADQKKTRDFQASPSASLPPEADAWNISAGPARPPQFPPSASLPPEADAWNAPAGPARPPQFPPSASLPPEADAWNAPAGPAHPPQFPPSASLPPEADTWNTSAGPDMQQAWPASATQAAGPNPWQNPGPAQMPDNPTIQEQWNGQAGPAPQPQPAPRPRGKLNAGRVFIALIILLLLLGGGYFAFTALGGHLPGLNITQSPITTTNLNSTVTYAGVDITVLNVQQAQNFMNDPQSASDGMVRLNLQEHNPTNVPVSWDYNQAARLLVQGKSALSPVYVQAKGTIAPGATQKSLLDFALANGGKLSNLSLQLGTSKEAQMQIPLTGTANLNQYEPRTTTQGGTLLYFGLNWTLNSSTTSLSIPGQQASSGMEFLTLDLTIDNTLSQLAISGSSFDYLRVQVGGHTLAPLSTTIPVSFATGEMGAKGVATFLIPQNNTACTLLMLSQDPGTSGQAKLDFQIP